MHLNKVKLQQDQLIDQFSNQHTPRKFIDNAYKVKKENDLRSTIPKMFEFDSQLICDQQANEAIIYKVTERKKVKKLWSKQEDNLLKQLVESKGAKQWAYISSHFTDRCGKQCRQRWHNHLRTGIKKGDWASYQEWILFLGVYAYGKKWSIISKILKGRTENTLKNHWNCKMKPKKMKFYNTMKNILTLIMNGSDLDLNAVQEKLFKEIRKNNNLEEVDDQKSTVFQVVECMKKAIKDYQALKKKVAEQFQFTKSQQNQLLKSPQKAAFFGSFQTFGKKRLNFDSTEIKKQFDQINDEIEVSSSYSQEYQIGDFIDEFQEDEKSEKQKIEKSEQEKSYNLLHECYFQSPSKNNLFVKINLEQSDQKN